MLLYVEDFMRSLGADCMKEHNNVNPMNFQDHRTPAVGMRTLRDALLMCASSTYFTENF